jgi:hypothetical protein
MPVELPESKLGAWLLVRRVLSETNCSVVWPARGRPGKQINWASLTLDDQLWLTCWPGSRRDRRRRQLLSLGLKPHNLWIKGSNGSSSHRRALSRRDQFFVYIHQHTHTLISTRPTQTNSSLSLLLPRQQRGPNLYIVGASLWGTTKQPADATESTSSWRDVFSFMDDLCPMPIYA